MPNQLTALGKWLRTFRLERDMRLKDMADKINLSSAHLSGIETGRKPVPSTLFEKIVKTYKIAGDNSKSLKEAIDQSIDVFKLSSVRTDRRDVAAALARRFNELSPEDIKHFREILNQGRGHE
ncbi:MAG: helix-turn-helix transcriptional regulator [Rhodospirillales bacterium]|nr:helix-turn-helix transcriptional regulator [Rhodospirillales bacterium]